MKIFIKFSIILIAAIQIVVAKADVSIPDYPGTLAAATPDIIARRAHANIGFDALDFIIPSIEFILHHPHSKISL